MDQSNISRTSGIKAKDKIGYLMGDFGSLCVFGLVQSVLQRYYTEKGGRTWEKHRRNQKIIGFTNTIKASPMAHIPLANGSDCFMNI